MRILARVALVAALFTLPLSAGAADRPKNRTDFKEHAAEVGLRVPWGSGAPTAKTGNVACDVACDTATGTIYGYNGSAFIPAGSGTQTGQINSTYNPSATTAAQSSILVTITSHAANEKAICLSSGTFCADAEGDTTVQTLTSTAGITATTVAPSTSLTIAGGTAITASLKVSGALDFGSIAQDACADLTQALTGATAGDSCIPGAPTTLNAGLNLSCFVSAADTVTQRVCNETAGAIDPASATFTARLFR